MGWRRWLKHGMRAALVATATLAGASCDSDPSDPSQCPAPHATFRLSVESSTGRLPEDVNISVRYGSGVEEFEPRFPPSSPAAMFCDVLRAKEAGPAGPIERITCDLWTDGAATVWVKAAGHVDVEQDLAAESDECGLLLTEERIVLEAKAD